MYLDPSTTNYAFGTKSVQYAFNLNREEDLLSSVETEICQVLPKILLSLVCKLAESNKSRRIFKGKYMMK